MPFVFLWNKLNLFIKLSQIYITILFYNVKQYQLSIFYVFTTPNSENVGMFFKFFIKFKTKRKSNHMSQYFIYNRT